MLTLPDYPLDIVVLIPHRRLHCARVKGRARITSTQTAARMNNIYALIIKH